MSNKKSLAKNVKQWDEIGVPYCLYCFKEITGKQKYNKNKFCSLAHRDKYNLLTKQITHKHTRVEEEQRACENPQCAHFLTEHQFKYCSPKCRKDTVSANRKIRPQCTTDGCKKEIPLGNTKYCSMKCRDKERTRRATEDRDKYWIKLACRNCGKVFEKTRAQADKFHNKFCSQLCYIEWQHTDKDAAGSRFMWDSKRNPQHSKKGTLEHFDSTVKNYLLLKDQDPEVVEWELPLASRPLGPNISFQPTVILQYKDGHKEAVEIAPPGESLNDKSCYSWQLVQFHIHEYDPAITKCFSLSTEEVDALVAELL